MSFVSAMNDDFNNFFFVSSYYFIILLLRFKRQSFKSERIKMKLGIKEEDGLRVKNV